ncbi:MAG TPA: PqqD family peptide modification chaperone [Terriglobales bacterium]|nr:PqqD family peptide modification chaperone [Terriglobales bacterium]
MCRIGRSPANWLAEELPQPDTTGAAAMDAPISLHTIVVAAPEQVSCPLGEESAILNLKNSVYYGMNPVGARVWDLLKQPKSVTELRNVLLEEYEVDEVRCGNDLLALLETLRSEGLIEIRGAAASA